jgi:hypothetical protein
MANDDKKFRITCQDVLYFNASRQSEPKLTREDIDRIVRETCSVPSSNKKPKDAVLAVTGTEKPIQARTVDNRLAGPSEQETLASTLSSLETLSAAVAHISPPTRTLPRPPMKESNDTAVRDLALSIQ